MIENSKDEELLPPGIAPERTGNSTFDGWMPGVPDPNNEKVKEQSDPEKPGIIIPSPPDKIG